MDKITMKYHSQSECTLTEEQPTLQDLTDEQQTEKTENDGQMQIKSPRDVQPVPGD